MKRRISALVFVLVLTLSILPAAFAHDRKEHEEDVEQVLFGSFFRESRFSDAEKAALKAIKAASYLAIDQYNSSGKDDLEYLAKYGVRQLPSGIDDINFSGNSRHRMYTHKGWQHEYNPDLAYWSTRKSILTQTAKKVFNFSESQNKQAEAFGAFIYYIHIVGDYVDEDGSNDNKQIMIDLGGRHDENDVIHQLKEYSETLFPSSKDTNAYSNFISQLNTLNGKFSKLVNSTGGVNTDEKKAQYEALAEKLMELLIDYVPGLLQREAWFTEVFPSTT